jgi:hypothetical protein
VHVRVHKTDVSPAEPGRKQDTMRTEEKTIVAANTAREPRTLEQLGVPGPLARELEATLRWMGRVQGERITGFTFRAVDGVEHALRTSAQAAAPRASEKAA